MPNKEYRYTKYFWLVNLNQAAYSKKQGEYFAKLLEKAVLHVFTQGDVVAFAADGPRWNRNYIGNNMLQVHIEVGPKMSRVHAHVIQEIKHRTVLNIDQQDARDAINDYISEQTGGRVDKCFVSRKIHPSAMPLEEYADKDNKDWRHTGEVPTLTSTYILKFGGKTAREELEEEDELAYEAYIATLQPAQNLINMPLYTDETSSSVRPPKPKRIKKPKAATSYKPASRKSKEAYISNSRFPISASSIGADY